MLNLFKKRWKTGRVSMTANKKPAPGSVDWDKVANHVLAAAELVRRNHARAVIKFDGERTNRKIYTVDVDGRGNDALDFREETADLEGSLTRAFPVGTGPDFINSPALAEQLRKWGSWVRRGYILSLDFLSTDGSMLYVVVILSEQGDFERVAVKGPVLLEVMQESTKRVEAQLGPGPSTATAS
jgi:hypothetical protein